MKLNAAFRLLAAAWWDRMTIEQQTLYLRTHPKSRKKVVEQQRKPEPALLEKVIRRAPTTPRQKSTPKTQPIEKSISRKEPPVGQATIPKRSLSTGKAAHKAASADLNPEQVQALKEYTGAMYLSVNPRLRAGKPVPREDRKEMKLVDEAFSKARTKEPIEVYRGIGRTDQDIFANIKIGESFNDGGFVSTSTDKNTAFNFARGD